MAAVEILGQNSTSTRSKPFKVEVGRAVVISSFNFQCAVTDDIGYVIRNADCAILHKLEMGGDLMPQSDGCCSGCVIDNLRHKILGSEPVVQCGELWTHTHECNLSVLTVPGYYMIELCSEHSLGSVSVKVEDLSIADAALIPTKLIHGS